MTYRNIHNLQVGTQLKCRITGEVFTVTKITEVFAYFDGPTAHGFVSLRHAKREFEIYGR